MTKKRDMLDQKGAITLEEAAQILIENPALPLTIRVSDTWRLYSKNYPMTAEEEISVIRETMKWMLESIYWNRLCVPVFGNKLPAGAQSITGFGRITEVKREELRGCYDSKEWLNLFIHSDDFACALKDGDFEKDINKFKSALESMRHKVWDIKDFSRNQKYKLEKLGAKVRLWWTLEADEKTRKQLNARYEALGYPGVYGKELFCYKALVRKLKATIKQSYVWLERKAGYWRLVWQFGKKTVDDINAKCSARAYHASKVQDEHVKAILEPYIVKDEVIIYPDKKMIKGAMGVHWVADDPRLIENLRVARENQRIIEDRKNDGI